MCDRHTGTRTHTPTHRLIYTNTSTHTNRSAQTHTHGVYIWSHTHRHIQSHTHRHKHTYTHENHKSKTTNKTPTLTIIIVIIIIVVFSILFKPCRKFESSYQDKTPAAARAALPIRSSTCSIFVRPNKCMAANALGSLTCAQMLMHAKTNQGRINTPWDRRRWLHNRRFRWPSLWRQWRPPDRRGGTRGFGARASDPCRSGKERPYASLCAPPSRICCTPAWEQIYIWSLATERRQKTFSDR